MSGGVAAALDQVMEGVGDMANVVQAGLFDEFEPSEIGNLNAPSPLVAALPSAQRKAGRPKGAKGKRTEAVTAYLLSQHRHPLQVMMEAYSMSPAELAKTIGILNPDADMLLDILKLQLRMAEVVSPYVAQKLPQALQVEAGASFTVNFGGDMRLGADRGVSSPARGEAPEISVGGGMAVRLGQVGRQQSDDELGD